jgi:hypothetical protein
MNARERPAFIQAGKLHCRVERQGAFLARD